MVIGLEAFREAFKGYEDCYTIIGGTACDILMNKANLDFRATRDIDMILLIESFLLPENRRKFQDKKGKAYEEL